MQTLNIQGGITEADKLMAIQDLVTKYEPDAMAISEAGQNCQANTLKWLNEQLKETTSGNENEYLSSLDAGFPYTIVSASTSAEHERGGIVFLLHNKWRHRVVGKPIIDHNGRWICIDVRTPRGRTSIIATYLPPSPQNSAAAKLAWTKLQEFVISRHLKRNRIVYLFGDLNASRNNSLHRKNTGEDELFPFRACFGLNILGYQGLGKALLMRLVEYRRRKEEDEPCDPVFLFQILCRDSSREQLILFEAYLLRDEQPITIA